MHFHVVWSSGTASVQQDTRIRESAIICKVIAQHPMAKLIYGAPTKGGSDWLLNSGLRINPASLLPYHIRLTLHAGRVTEV